MGPLRDDLGLGAATAKPGSETALPTANGGCCEASYDRDVRAGGWGTFRQPSQGNRLGGQLSAMAHRPRVRDLGQLAG
jgi:hypothetical protein